MTIFIKIQKETKQLEFLTKEREEKRDAQL